jgi:hypothetical protein
MEFPGLHGEEMVLGSGGLTIGQAGEFDYSGSQAIKALREAPGPGPGAGAAKGEKHGYYDGYGAISAMTMVITSYGSSLITINDC